MMPAHGRLSIPEMTHHESRIREEDEDSQSGDVPTTSGSPGESFTQKNDFSTIIPVTIPVTEIS
jgi:hypothetical protein